MKRGKALMKTQEAADYLGINRSTLYAWLKQKRKLTYSIDPVTGYRYFKKDDLDQFLAGRVVK